MMRPEQIARLQRLARLRETKAHAALGVAKRARDRLEAERDQLSEHLRAATPAPGGTDAAHYHAAARLDEAFRQGIAAYRHFRPERDAAVEQARADYARALGQLRALGELQASADTMARRKREAREEEQRNVSAQPPPGGGAAR